MKSETMIALCFALAAILSLKECIQSEKTRALELKIATLEGEKAARK